MRNTLVVAGVAVAALGASAVIAVAWLFPPESTGEAVSAPQRESPTLPEQPTQGFASQVIRGEHDGADSLRAEAPPPPVPPEPQGIEDGGVAPQPESDYSWKYGSSSEEQLARVLAELDGKLQQRADDLILRRFDAGLYDEFPVAGQPIDKLIAQHRPEGLLGQLRVKLDTSSNAATSQTTPLSVQVVTLPRGEFPELYELYDERGWLQRRLGTSQKP